MVVNNTLPDGVREYRILSACSFAKCPRYDQTSNLSLLINRDNHSGLKLKLLACAECDLGPLGWCEEGGKEFWLACTRVGYLA